MAVVYGAAHLPGISHYLDHPTERAAKLLSYGPLFGRASRSKPSRYTYRDEKWILRKRVTFDPAAHASMACVARCPSNKTLHKKWSIFVGACQRIALTSRHCGGSGFGSWPRGAAYWPHIAPAVRSPPRMPQRHVRHVILPTKHSTKSGAFVGAANGDRPHLSPLRWLGIRVLASRCGLLAASLRPFDPAAHASTACAARCPSNKTLHKKWSILLGRPTGIALTSPLRWLGIRVLASRCGLLAAHRSGRSIPAAHASTACAAR